MPSQISGCVAGPIRVKQERRKGETADLRLPQSRLSASAYVWAFPGSIGFKTGIALQSMAKLCPRTSPSPPVQDPLRAGEIGETTTTITTTLTHWLTEGTTRQEDEREFRAKMLT